MLWLNSGRLGGSLKIKNNSYPSLSFRLSRREMKSQEFSVKVSQVCFVLVMLLATVP